MVPTLLEVTYDGPAGIRHDYETQFKVGGLFAQLDAPSGLPPLAEVTLVLLVGEAELVRVKTRLTVAGGGTVCLEIAPPERAILATAVDLACGTGVPDGKTERLRVRFVDPASCTDAPVVATEKSGSTEKPVEDDKTESGSPPSPRRAKTDDLSLERKIAGMTTGEKVQLAMHGDAVARALLIRERVAAVQHALVKNPRIGLEEVKALARSSTLSAEGAEAISRHPSWGMSPQVALTLVRNPRIPTPVAALLVSRLTAADLRMVAKGTGVRAQVAAAARKRLLES